MFLPPFSLSFFFFDSFATYTTRYNINSIAIIYIYVSPEERRGGSPPSGFSLFKSGFYANREEIHCRRGTGTGERAIHERWSFVPSVEKRRTRPATVYARGTTIRFVAGRANVPPARVPFAK